jgi:hypothetical protein
MRAKPEIEVRNISATIRINREERECDLSAGARLHMLLKTAANARSGSGFFEISFFILLGLL